MCKTIALLLISLVLASGQGSKLSDAQRQAILDYQLTLPRANQLIAAMEAMTKYVASLPDFAERMRKAMTQTPAQRLADFEADPKAMAIAKQNGLTAKEYLVGVPALRMALLAAQGMVGPSIIASPANVAFAKANLAELKPKMDAADSVRPARK
ncbi:MAG TPA: hypothetical protein VEU96_09155 [Bryobacteraceae bacterium]|nr:hypothetical protein [Bryobacteraceae bacterium]